MADTSQSPAESSVRYAREVKADRRIRNWLMKNFPAYPKKQRRGRFLSLKSDRRINNAPTSR